MAAAEGNQYASKAKLWTEAIYQALERRAKGEKRPRVEILADFADKLLDAADSGDLQALQELGNRIEGRPTQRIESESTIEVVVRFQREPEVWQAIEHEVSPLSSKIESLPEGARETMKLVLQDVPTADHQVVFDKALGTVLAASGRGANETPPNDLIQKQEPDVAELAQGFMANLDLETEEERAKFEDAQARVNQHNANVRARKA